MRIYVEGKEAVLKEGMSFEYISENPLFTDAEDYTMEIEFPLKDRPENILIFGALHVQGVDILNISYSCEMDFGSFRKTGLLTIIEVNEAEVKGQFLEGMSTDRFEIDALSAYIDEIDYSALDGSDGVAEHVQSVLSNKFVNLVVYDKDKDEVFHANSDYGLRHIYLSELISWICDYCGIKVDVDKLYIIGKLYTSMVVANTTGDTNYCDIGNHRHRDFMKLNKTLPHWTVRQFLVEVGRLFGCKVLFNMLHKTAKFVPYTLLLSANNLVKLEVNEDFSVELSDEDEINKVGKYKLPDECNPDNINSCPHIFEYLNEVAIHEFTDPYERSFEYLATVRHYLINYYRKSRLYEYDSSSPLLNRYVAIIDKVDRQDGSSDLTDSIQEFMKFERLNQYGTMEGEDLKVVPCNLEIKRIPLGWKIENGWEYNLSGQNITLPFRMPVIEIQRINLEKTLDNRWVYDFNGILEAEGGKIENQYEKLYVVLYNENFSDKSKGYHIYTRAYEPEAGEEYAPDTITATGGEVPTYNNGFTVNNESITPNNEKIQNNVAIPNVDYSLLYRFKFLSNDIPSPVNIFIINGQRYACLRIKARFTSTGMSELMEGEFYRIIS